MIQDTKAPEALILRRTATPNRQKLQNVYGHAESLKLKGRAVANHGTRWFSTGKIQSEKLN